jgi:hypothetical protein
VPGLGYVCLISQQVRGVVGTVCNSTSKAVKQGLSVCFLGKPNSAGRSPWRIIAGIAPDGRVAIARTHGKDAWIKIVGGYFERRDRVNDPPDRVTVVKAPLP